MAGKGINEMAKGEGMTDARLRDIEDRLINWGRAQRDNKNQGRCRSIEHRYDARSDKGDEVIAGEARPTGMIDYRDSLIINRAWLKLPIKHRKLLAMHYIPHRPHYTKIAFTLGIRMSEYDYQIQRAQMMVRNILAFNLKQ